MAVNNPYQETQRLETMNLSRNREENSPLATRGIVPLLLNIAGRCPKFKSMKLLLCTAVLTRT